MIRIAIAAAVITLFTTSFTSAKDSVVTLFCYDWSQGERTGLQFSAVPFYLQGYGRIEDVDELEKVLRSFKLLEARKDSFGSGPIRWEELSQHKLGSLDDLLPEQCRPETFEAQASELILVPTLVFTRSGKQIWMFVIKVGVDEQDKGKVVGILRDLN